MFSIPRVNVIESDEGFSVELLGSTGMRYKDAQGSIFVDSEILAGPAGLMLISSSIKRWENTTNDVSAEERERIVDNIKRAFKFRGVTIQIM